ncbi:uncharacterized protein LOC101449144 [Ceratitis capitata]|uniref:uncharacterized protein LOC101449144 n=1 Tax=Ceratitis capitata TaxID=7213 RepID=UPI0006188B73|nr:uncharacterized protein LOC101449144 [Ceratitis capitata]
MSAKLLLFALAISVVSSCCLAYSQLDFQPMLEEHNRVFRQLAFTMNTNRAVMVGYEQSNICFDWYMGDQTAISTTYNNEYNACVNASIAAKQALSEQSALDRSELLDAGNSICSALSDCESREDSLQFFQCYYNASSDNTGVLFNISTKAERISNNLTILYKAVEDTELFCTNEARTKNILSLTESTNKLNSCLHGEWNPVSTTEATTTTTTTTVEPTTAAPTTAAPETPDGDGSDSDDAQRAPEEDIFRYQPRTRMNKWNIMRRL